MPSKVATVTAGATPVLAVRATTVTCTGVQAPPLLKEPHIYPHVNNLHRERSRGTRGKGKSKELQIQFEKARKEEEKQEEKEPFPASNCTDHPSTVQGSRLAHMTSPPLPAAASSHVVPGDCVHAQGKSLGRGLFSGQDYVF